MAREPEELTELWRALGAQLITYRVAAKLTQGQLARAGNYHPSAMSHIEKGRAHGTERFWKLADEQCGAQGALLAAFRTVQAAKQEHEVRAEEEQLKQAQAKAATLRFSVTGNAVTAGRVAGDECPGTAEDQAMRRREAIGLAARLTVDGDSCRDAVLGHLHWALQLRKATASDPVRAALNAELARLQNLTG